MDNSNSYLRKNDRDRWQIGDCELTSGNLIEIKIDDYWVTGVIEHWHDNYYWFSRRDGVPVVLHSGIYARFPNSSERSR